MPITGSQKALMFAQSGVLRAGAGRSNYTSGLLYLSIAGVHYATGRASSLNAVRLDNITIVQNLDDIPDTCTFTLRGAAPLNGQTVLIGLGSKNTYDLLFGGVIMMPTSTELKTKPTGALHQVSCVDFTWMLTRHKISRRYTSMSATDIALDIMTNAPVGFTTYGVQSGLDTIDEFTITNETRIDALRRLAKRIGAYLDISPYKDVRFGTSDRSGTNPATITSSHQTLSEFSFSRDMSQMTTRAFVEGGGGTVLTSVDAGETILPVDSLFWYNSGGGVVVAGPQRIAYGTTREGGAGTLVGPGTGPAGAMAGTPSAGAGVDSGTHLYAYTFVTGSGESLPSPTNSVTVGGSIADPTVAPGPGGFSSAANPPPPYPFSAGDHERWWAYTFVTAGGETLASPVFVPIAGDLAPIGPYYFTMIVPTGPTGTTNRNVYRTVAGGAQLKLVAAMGNNTTTIYNDHTFDGSLGANAPLTNTASIGNQVALTGIGIGGSGTTARKIYRTVAGGSQLKLVGTIADNTTTVYTDSTADGSLGANAPTSDTSGLTQPNGQVLAGSTSLLVAGTGAFSASGGWAIIAGRFLIRYTGISGSSLTGIPASGNGALGSTVAYNSTVTVAASLEGIPPASTGAILYDIGTGEPANLLVQVDDATAQAYLVSLIGGSEDGVIEDYVQDGRLSETEARARAQAMIDLRSGLNDGVRLKCRDQNFRAGRTVTVSLSSPISVADSFKIQTVTISWETTKARPFFAVTASDQRYTFEDILRRIKEGSNGVNN